MDVKYVYGPVPSRRLGMSLGVSPVPSKTCNYSCVYCQLGRTDRFTNERKDFFDPEEILEEILRAVKDNSSIDYVSFVGEGEPTLCRSIGYLVNETKSRTRLPVAVITNGALLCEEAVREDLKNADVVLPSLDAGSRETFLRIDRPRKEIDFEATIEGLKEFSRVRRGRLWIEVMLVKDLNDSQGEIAKIERILEGVKPDRVYLNVPIRPPAEPWVEIPDERSIAMAHETLRSYLISGYEEGEFHMADPEGLYEEILTVCARHPMREEQVRNLCMKFGKDADDLVSKMKKDRSVRKIEYNGRLFFVAKPKRET